MSISNKQLATALLLASNSEYKPRQVAVIGAGQGKARVASAIALYFLKTTNRKVYILFSDRGLMQRDQTECERLWRFLSIAEKKEHDRISHICDV